MKSSLKNALKGLLAGLGTTVVLLAILVPLAYLERKYWGYGGEWFASIIVGMFVGVKVFDKAEIKRIRKQNKAG